MGEADTVAARPSNLEASSEYAERDKMLSDSSVPKILNKALRTFAIAASSESFRLEVVNAVARPDVRIPAVSP